MIGDKLRGGTGSKRFKFESANTSSSGTGNSTQTFNNTYIGIPYNNRRILVGIRNFDNRDDSTTSMTLNGIAMERISNVDNNSGDNFTGGGISLFTIEDSANTVVNFSAGLERGPDVSSRIWVWSFPDDGDLFCTSSDTFLSDAATKTFTVDEDTNGHTIVISQGTSTTNNLTYQSQTNLDSVDGLEYFTDADDFGTISGYNSYTNFATNSSYSITWSSSIPGLDVFQGAFHVTSGQYSPSFVGLTSNSTGNLREGLTFTLPTGVQTGDLLIAYVYMNNSDNTLFAEDSVNITGWEFISRTTGNSTTNFVFYRYADGSETDIQHVNFNADASNNTLVKGYMVAYRNSVIIKKVTTLQTGNINPGTDVGDYSKLLIHNFDDSTNLSETNTLNNSQFVPTIKRRLLSGTMALHETYYPHATSATGTITVVTDTLTAKQINYLTELNQLENQEPVLISSSTDSGLDNQLFLPLGDQWLPGDIAIACLTSGQSGGGTWTVPSGWTELADLGTSPNLAVAYKMLEPGDGTPSFTFSGGVALGQMIVMRYAKFESIGSFGTGTQSATAGSTTTDSGYIAIFAADGNGNTFTTPSGTTTLASFDGTSATVASFLNTSAVGTTGTVSSTYNVSAPVAGIVIGLQPVTTSDLSYSIDTPVYISHITYLGGSETSTKVLDFPAGYANGDLLIATIGTSTKNDNVGAVVISTPSGWTKQCSTENFRPHLTVFTRFLDGTEGSNVTFTSTGTQTNLTWGASIVCIRNANNVTVGANSAIGSGATGTISVPGVTADHTLRLITGLGSENANMDPPVNYTQILESDDTPSVFFGSRDLSGSSTASVNLTWDGGGGDTRVSGAQILIN